MGIFMKGESEKARNDMLEKAFQQFANEMDVNSQLNEFRKLFSGKRFGIIENSPYLDPIQDTLEKAYGVSKIHLMCSVPDDLLSWVIENRIDAILIHPHSVQDLEQIILLKVQGYKVGVIKRSVGGAFPDGFHKMMSKVLELGIICVDKSFSASDFAEDLSLVLRKG